MDADRAYVSEVFSSAQGEGPHVGRRHLFVRLAGCNRRCRYCDTPRGLEPRPASALLETEPGSGRRAPATNPLSAGDVLAAVDRLHAFPGLHHAAALTGGEPLLWDRFLARLLPGLRDRGLPVLLETNASLPDALPPLLPLLDIVSADLKLPSATGEPLDRREAGRFLALAARRRLVVKIVVSADLDADEADEAFRLVADRAPEAVTVLQPLSAVPGGPEPPGATLLLRLQARALHLLGDVRVIPQTHKPTGLP